MILRLSSAFFLSASAFSFFSAAHCSSRLLFRSTDSGTAAASASADDICAENNSATPQSRAEGDGANARARVPEDAGAVGSPGWPACGGRTRKRGEAAAEVVEKEEGSRGGDDERQP